MHALQATAAINAFPHVRLVIFVSLLATFFFHFLYFCQAYGLLLRIGRKKYELITAFEFFYKLGLGLDSIQRGVSDLLNLVPVTNDLLVEVGTLTLLFMPPT